MQARFLCGLALAGYSLAAQAGTYYTGNPYTPYPPGCATLLTSQASLYGGNAARFWSGSLWLEVVQKLQSDDPFKNLGQVDLSLYRVACAEPGRSLILAEFRLPAEWVDPRNSQLVLPSFAFEAPGGFHYVELQLNAEPNVPGQAPGQREFTKYAIGNYGYGWYDPPPGWTWRYVLDMSPAGGGPEPDVTASYNEPQGPLYVLQNDELLAAIDMPATPALVQPNPALPLNGRLNGVWVEDAAADQGLVLSFGNPIPAAGPQADAPESADLLVFLSWYTFGANGEALWLTGAAQFPQGSTEVQIPVELVEHGQFLGGKTAERSVIGTARLKASSCNELELEYDLSNLGLAAGDIRLQRFQALETAGYPCRDYKARQDSLFSANSQ